MPTDTVWMTMQEIADMYNVFGCYVRKAVKAIFKDGILKEQGVRRHVRKNDRISYDVYSLELVIAVIPKYFFAHAASLHQAFAHCAIFPTAASRRSLGRVSVPM